MKSKLHLNRFRLLVALVVIALAGVASAQERPYPENLRKWVDGGKYVKFEGLDIFVHASGTSPVKGHGVLVVHGYPGSSWDFSNVVSTVEKETKIVVLDMIGFGQSDKPLQGTFKDNFSLMRQADLYEAIAKAEGLEEVILVAHDMGQSVGLELMTRHDEGKLSFKIRHAILLDGSTLVDMVQLDPLQVEGLKAGDKALTEHKDFNEYATGMLASFAPENRQQETVEIMTHQIFANDGDLVIDQILQYLLERKEFYDRWVGTFAHFRTAPLSIYWGVKDPVAVVAMADRIKTWNPTIDLYKLPHSGHWPSIENPDIIAAAIIARMPIYDNTPK
jgi:pimeloyl-ACP methyl ester carboxylesterase